MKFTKVAANITNLINSAITIGTFDPNRLINRSTKIKYSQQSIKCIQAGREIWHGRGGETSYLVYIALVYVFIVIMYHN